MPSADVVEKTSKKPKETTPDESGNDQPFAVESCQERGISMKNPKYRLPIMIVEDFFTRWNLAKSFGQQIGQDPRNKKTAGDVLKKVVNNIAKRDYLTQDEGNLILRCVQGFEVQERILKSMKHSDKRFNDRVFLQKASEDGLKVALLEGFNIKL